MAERPNERGASHLLGPLHVVLSGHLFLVRAHLAHRLFSASLFQVAVEGGALHIPPPLPSWHPGRPPAPFLGCHKPCLPAQRAVLRILFILQGSTEPTQSQGLRLQCQSRNGNAKQEGPSCEKGVALWTSTLPSVPTHLLIPAVLPATAVVGMSIIPSRYCRTQARTSSISCPRSPH